MIKQIFLRFGSIIFAGFVIIVGVQNFGPLYSADNSCETGDAKCMEKMPGMGMEHSEHMKGMHQHKESQDIRNPVKKTPKNLVEGGELYEKNCVRCHGKEGKGDGTVGKALRPPASNLADNKWKHGSTDGEIFNVISEGVPETAMSGWKSILSEEDRWKMVNYLRCFAEMKKSTYQCPMHPNVKSNLPGKCPKCGMYLEKKRVKKGEDKEHKH